MNWRTSNYATLTVACFVLLCHNALANDSTGATAAELPSILVNASRSSTAVEDADLSTTVIQREEIQAMAGQSLDQILNRIASVRTSDVMASSVHPTGQQLLMRGFGNARTLILLDGIPLNDAFYNTVSWESVPKESIERIEVIRGGAASSLWGNLALGGVINVITRKPEAGQLNASATLGSFNTQRYYGQAGFAVNEQVKVGIEASHYQTDGYNLTPRQFQTAGLSNTSGLANTVKASAFFTPTARTKAFLKASLYDAHEDGLTYQLAHNTLTTYNVTAGIEHQLNESTSIQTNAYSRRTQFFTQNVGLRSGNNCGANGTSSCTSYNYQNPNSSPGFVVTLRDNNPYDDFGGSAIVSTQLTGLTSPLQVGVDYRKITGSTDGIRFDTKTSSDQGPVVGEVLSKGQQNFTGVFAQNTWLFKTVPAQITVSAREDFYSNSNGSRSDVLNNAVTPLPDNTFSRFDPRLSGKYFLTNDLDVRAAAYRAFRAPGMNNLYRTFISGTSVTLSNSTLKPETVTGAELGVDWRFNQGSLEATAFYNSVSDLIDSTSIDATSALCQSALNGAKSCRQNQNIAQAQIKGLELVGRYGFTKHLTGGLSYTRNISTITASNAPTSPVNNQIGGIPAYNAIGSLDWTPVESLQLFSQVRFTPTYFNDTAHTQVNDHATLVDLSARYTLSKHTKLSVQLNNVFDRRYISTGSNSASTLPVQGSPRMGFVSMNTAF